MDAASSAAWHDFEGGWTPHHMRHDVSLLVILGLDPGIHGISCFSLWMPYRVRHDFEGGWTPHHMPHDVSLPVILGLDPGIHLLIFESYTNRLIWLDISLHLLFVNPYRFLIPTNLTMSHRDRSTQGCLFQ